MVISKERLTCSKNQSARRCRSLILQRCRALMSILPRRLRQSWMGRVVTNSFREFRGENTNLLSLSNFVMKLFFSHEKFRIVLLHHLILFGLRARKYGDWDLVLRLVWDAVTVYMKLGYWSTARAIYIITNMNHVHFMTWIQNVRPDNWFRASILFK